MKFSSDKSQVLVVEGRRRIERDRWRLGDLEIKRTNEYKYLDIPVTVNEFDKARGEKGTKALQWWGMLSGLAKQRANKYEVIRGLWKAIAVPSIMYGVEAMDINGGELRNWRLFKTGWGDWCFGVIDMWQ